MREIKKEISTRFQEVV